MWIVGDTFVATSVQQNFIQQRGLFTNNYFEVNYFASNRFFSHERNALSRVRNNLVFAMNTKKMLPKIISVVLRG